MRLLEAPPALLSILSILLTTSHPTRASPFSKLANIIHQQLDPRDESESLQNNTLAARSNCLSTQFACGYYGQACCITGSEYCTTNAQNQAVCLAGTGSAVVSSGAGYYTTLTSTWVDTVTRTSIYSTWVPGTATVAVSGGATCTPNWANNESQCGANCCLSGQYCADTNLGICKSAGNGGFTTTGVAASSVSAPLRPTSSGVVIITNTISPTTTVAFATPSVVGSSGQNGTLTGTGGGGLSGGAIAGIVIGTLAGLALLILFCVCCCLKAGFDGILALFGMGKKKRRRRVVEEEYVSEHRRTSGSNGRWYGSAAGSRPSRPPPPPKKSGVGGLGLAAGLGGLALALGLKRKHDRKQEDKSDYTSSSYGYYDTSSSSSDDRTRRSSRR